MNTAIKLICSAGLKCPEIPTSPDKIETAYIEGIGLAGIDFIIEITAIERPNLHEVSQKIIAGLNTVYPNQIFSVYFNLIQEKGLAHTPRSANNDKPLTIEEAVRISKSYRPKNSTEFL